MNQVLTTIAGTYAAGADIASNVAAGDIITLTGDLGTGKTTLAKGILAYFGIDPDTVTSPTFSIMNIYVAAEHNDQIKQIVHIDTYRLTEAEELLDIGFEDYMTDPHTLTIIEWPEKLEHILGSSKNTVHRYTLAYSDDARILKNAA